MIFSEWYGHVSEGQLRAYRKYNVTQADHDDLIEAFGEGNHREIEQAVRDVKNHSSGQFDSYIFARNRASVHEHRLRPLLPEGASLSAAMPTLAEQLAASEQPAPPWDPDTLWVNHMVAMRAFRPLIDDVDPASGRILAPPSGVDAREPWHQRSFPASKSVIEAARPMAAVVSNAGFVVSGRQLVVSNPRQARFTLDQLLARAESSIDDSTADPNDRRQARNRARSLSKIMGEIHAARVWDNEHFNIGRPGSILTREQARRAITGLSDDQAQAFADRLSGREHAPDVISELTDGVANPEPNISPLFILSYTYQLAGFDRAAAWELDRVEEAGERQRMAAVLAGLRADLELNIRTAIAEAYRRIDQAQDLDDAREAFYGYRRGSGSGAGDNGLQVNVRGHDADYAAIDRAIAAAVDGANDDVAATRARDIVTSAMGYRGMNVLRPGTRSSMIGSFSYANAGNVGRATGFQRMEDRAGNGQEWRRQHTLAMKVIQRDGPKVEGFEPSRYSDWSEADPAVLSSPFSDVTPAPRASAPTTTGDIKPGLMDEGSTLSQAYAWARAWRGNTIYGGAWMALEELAWRERRGEAISAEELAAARRQTVDRLHGQVDYAQQHIDRARGKKEKEHYRSGQQQLAAFAEQFAAENAAAAQITTLEGPPPRPFAQADLSWVPAHTSMGTWGETAKKLDSAEMRDVRSWYGQMIDSGDYGDPRRYGDEAHLLARRMRWMDSTLAQRVENPNFEPQLRGTRRDRDWQEQRQRWLEQRHITIKSDPSISDEDRAETLYRLAHSVPSISDLDGLTVYLTAEDGRPVDWDQQADRLTLRNGWSERFPALIETLAERASQGDSHDHERWPYPARRRNLLGGPSSVRAHQPAPATEQKTQPTADLAPVVTSVQYPEIERLTYVFADDDAPFYVLRISGNDVTGNLHGAGVRTLSRGQLRNERGERLGDPNLPAGPALKAEQARHTREVKLEQAFTPEGLVLGATEAERAEGYTLHMVDPRSGWIRQDGEAVGWVRERERSAAGRTEWRTQYVDGSGVGFLDHGSGSALEAASAALHHLTQDLGDRDLVGARLSSIDQQTMRPDASPAQMRELVALRDELTGLPAEADPDEIRALRWATSIYGSNKTPGSPIDRSDAEAVARLADAAAGRQNSDSVAGRARARVLQGAATSMRRHAYLLSRGPLPAPGQDDPGFVYRPTSLASQPQSQGGGSQAPPDPRHRPEKASAQPPAPPASPPIGAGEQLDLLAALPDPGQGHMALDSVARAGHHPAQLTASDDTPQPERPPMSEDTLAVLRTLLGPLDHTEIQRRLAVHTDALTWLDVGTPIPAETASVLHTFISAIPEDAVPGAVTAVAVDGQLTTSRGRFPIYGLTFSSAADEQVRLHLLQASGQLLPINIEQITVPRPPEEPALSPVVRTWEPAALRDFRTPAAVDDLRNPRAEAAAHLEELCWVRFDEPVPIRVAEALRTFTESVPAGALPGTIDAVAFHPQQHDDRSQAVYGLAFRRPDGAETRIHMLVQGDSLRTLCLDETSPAQGPPTDQPATWPTLAAPRTASPRSVRAPNPPASSGTPSVVLVSR